MSKSPKMIVLTEKNVARVVKRILNEELDPQHDQKVEAYKKLILADLSIADVDALIERNAEAYYENGTPTDADEDGKYAVHLDADRLAEMVGDDIPGSKVVDDFLAKHQIPDEDTDLVVDIIIEVVAHYLTTIPGKQELGNALANAREGAGDTDYIKKHGINAYYGVSDKDFM